MLDVDLIHKLWDFSTARLKSTSAHKPSACPLNRAVIRSTPRGPSRCRPSYTVGSKLFAKKRLWHLKHKSMLTSISEIRTYCKYTVSEKINLVPFLVSPHLPSHIHIASKLHHYTQSSFPCSSYFDIMLIWHKR